MRGVTYMRDMLETARETHNMAVLSFPPTPGEQCERYTLSQLLDYTESEHTLQEVECTFRHADDRICGHRNAGSNWRIVFTFN